MTLPPGWSTAVSRSTGETYYVNDATGETQYELPTAPTPAPAPSGSAAQLPAGWVSHISRSSGEAYYENTATGETTFDFPQGPPSYQAPAPALTPATAELPTAPTPAPAPSGSAAQLPAGWVSHISRSSGEAYYENTATGETTFDFPQGPSSYQAPAPALAPATAAAPQFIHSQRRASQNFSSSPLARAFGCQSPRRPRDAVSSLPVSPRMAAVETQTAAATTMTSAGGTNSVASTLAAVEKKLRNGAPVPRQPRAARAHGRRRNESGGSSSGSSGSGSGISGSEDTDSYSEFDSDDSESYLLGEDAGHRHGRRRSRERSRIVASFRGKPSRGRSRDGRRRQLASGGQFTVQVLRCKDLVGGDRNGLSDPYVTLKLGDGQYAQYEETRRIEKTRFPVWEHPAESFSFTLVGESDQPGLTQQTARYLQVEVMDWNRAATDTFLGEVTVDMHEVFGEDWSDSASWMQTAHSCQQMFPLMDPQGRVKLKDKHLESARAGSHRTAYGSVELELSFVPKATSASSSARGGLRSTRQGRRRAHSHGRSSRSLGRRHRHRYRGGSADYDDESAATLIQALYRGRAARERRNILHRRLDASHSLNYRRDSGNQSLFTVDREYTRHSPLTQQERTELALVDVSGHWEAEWDDESGQRRVLGFVLQQDLSTGQLDGHETPGAGAKPFVLRGRLAPASGALRLTQLGIDPLQPFAGGQCWWRAKLVGATGDFMRGSWLSHDLNSGGTADSSSLRHRQLRSPARSIDDRGSSPPIHRNTSGLAETGETGAVNFSCMSDTSTRGLAQNEDDERDSEEADLSMAEMANETPDAAEGAATTSSPTAAAAAAERSEDTAAEQSEGIDPHQASSWEHPATANNGDGSGVQFVARRVAIDVGSIPERTFAVVENGFPPVDNDEVDDIRHSSRRQRRLSYPPTVSHSDNARWTQERGAGRDGLLLRSAEQDDTEFTELTLLELQRVRSKLKKAKHQLLRYQKTDLPVALQRALLAERTGDSARQELQQARIAAKQAQDAAETSRKRLEAEEAQHEQSVAELSIAAEQEREELLAVEAQLREDLEAAETGVREAREAREELEQSMEEMLEQSQEINASKMSWENDQLKKTINKLTKQLSKVQSSVAASQERRQREWTFSPWMMKAIGWLLCSTGVLSGVGWLVSGYWGVALVVLSVLALWGLLALGLLTFSTQLVPEKLVDENISQLRNWMLADKWTPSPRRSSRSSPKRQQSRQLEQRLLIGQPHMYQLGDQQVDDVESFFSDSDPAPEYPIDTSFSVSGNDGHNGNDGHSSPQYFLPNRTVRHRHSRSRSPSPHRKGGDTPCHKSGDALHLSSTSHRSTGSPTLVVGSNTRNFRWHD